MEIRYCNSFWDLSPIDSLKKALKEYTLDPVFEDYGNFFYEVDEVYVHFASAWPSRRPLDRLEPCQRYWTVTGNFYDLSHTFSIVTDNPQEPEFLELVELVKANQSSEGYRKAKQERKSA